MPQEREELLFDPICDMWLAPDQVATTYTYIGRTYGFCSFECPELFVRRLEAPRWCASPMTRRRTWDTPLQRSTKRSPIRPSRR